MKYTNLLLLALLSGSHCWEVDFTLSEQNNFYKSDKTYSCISSYNLTAGQSFRIRNLEPAQYQVEFFQREYCDGYSWRYYCDDRRNTVCGETRVIALDNSSSFRVVDYPRFEYPRALTL